MLTLLFERAGFRVRGAKSGARGLALAAGFDAFFPKPIRPESFVQEIARFLPATPHAARRAGTS